MKLALLALAPLIVAAGAAVPAGTVDKQGVARFAYDYGRPPAIVCAPSITCDIELDRGEIVGDIVSGDSIKRDAQSGWIIAQGKQGLIPHIYVSPQKEHGLTNLLVTTNRRPYALYLVATTAANVKTWRYGFTYADNVVAIASPAPSASSEAVDTPSPTPRNYGYNVSGDARFSPHGRLLNRRPHLRRAASASVELHCAERRSGREWPAAPGRLGVRSRE